MMTNLAVIDDRKAPATVTPFAMDNPVFDPAQFQAMAQVAEMMASCKLVPEHLQKSQGDCFLVVEQARRWNMSPFAVAQETYSIKGKLLFGGKLVTAVINARAPIDAPLKFDAVKVDGEDGVRASGTFNGESDPRTYEISINKARSVAGNSSLWKTDPFQQACYFAARFWARRHCPEVILGVWSEDEIRPAHFGPEEARDVTPAAPVNALAEALAEIDEEPEHDADTGEIVETASEPPALDPTRPKPIGGTVDQAWCGKFVAAINGAPDSETLESWISVNTAKLEECGKVNPSWRNRIEERIGEARERVAA